MLIQKNIARFDVSMAEWRVTKEMKILLKQEDMEV